MCKIWTGPDLMRKRRGKTKKRQREIHRHSFNELYIQYSHTGCSHSAKNLTLLHFINYQYSHEKKDNRNARFLGKLLKVKFALSKSGAF